LVLRQQLGCGWGWVLQREWGCNLAWLRRQQLGCERGWVLRWRKQARARWPKVTWMLGHELRRVLLHEVVQVR
jgi:hypothetical protein